MLKGRNVTIWLAVAALLMLMTVTVQGHEVLDMTRTGSICLTVKDGSVPLDGGTLWLYRVGDIVESDGDYSFALVDALKDSQVNLENIQSSETAKKLADWLKKKSVQRTEMEINDKGQAVFYDLKLGLYLIVQNKAAEGYLPVEPFLVSVPMHDKTGYIYDVEATPKVEVEKAPTEPEETKPPHIKDPQLPQTGQNNWQVLALACSGLLFVILGVYLFRKEKKTQG